MIRKVHTKGDFLCSASLFPNFKLALQSHKGAAKHLCNFAEH